MCCLFIGQKSAKKSPQYHYRPFTLHLKTLTLGKGKQNISSFQPEQDFIPSLIYKKRKRFVGANICGIGFLLTVTERTEEVVCRSSQYLFILIKHQGIQTFLVRPIYTPISGDTDPFSQTDIHSNIRGYRPL